MESYDEKQSNDTNSLILLFIWSQINQFNGWSSANNPLTKDVPIF